MHNFGSSKIDFTCTRGLNESLTNKVVTSSTTNKIKHQKKYSLLKILKELQLLFIYFFFQPKMALFLHKMHFKSKITLVLNNLALTN